MHVHTVQVYEAIQEELADGGRAYIICPLVGESSAKGFTDTKVRHHETPYQCMPVSAGASQNTSCKPVCHNLLQQEP